MSLDPLLADLAARGIELWFEGDRLRFRAPAGAFTAQQKAELSARRTEVVAQLRALASQGEKTPPLSYGQRSLWFLSQESPESFSYNVGFAARIGSSVDPGYLRHAMQALVDRHASLRTRFPVVNGTPVQAVSGSVSVALEFCDVTGLDDVGLRARVQAEYQRPFNLESGPIFRATLFTRGPTDHVLLLNVHHIAADGWSFLQLLEEFRSLYGEAAGGPPASLARPEIQYADYTAWQSEVLAGPEGRRLLEYWERKLAAPRVDLELPADRRRPARRSSQGATFAFNVDSALTQAARQFARGENTTVFVVLLAAFKSVLFRYTGSEDVIVGTPAFGRSKPEFARVVGDFINAVPLRSRIDAGLSFRELLGQLRQTVFEALDAQECPLSLIVERLAPPRDLSRSPLFEILFVLQRFEQMKELEPLLLPTDSDVMFDFGGLQMRGFPLDQQEGQFDLTMQVVDGSGPLAVQFKYNPELFDTDRIQRMAAHFTTLLDGAIRGPGLPVGGLPMLTPTEQGELSGLSRGTVPAAERPSTVHDMFEVQVRRNPDSVAVWFEAEQLGYRELGVRANQLARHLQSMGVARGGLVGIWMERSVDMVVAVLGILKSGAAYVPLDPAFPRDRIDFMVEDAALQVVVTQASLADLLARPGLGMVRMDTDRARIEAHSGEKLAATVSADDLAYMIYTSGSTGRPKGVELKHGGMVNLLASMHRQPGITSLDRFVAVTTLSFDIAGLEILGPLTAGGMVVLADRAAALDSALLAPLLKQIGATILQATPATWRLLLESGWRGAPGLKMISGGEALRPDLAAKLLAICEAQGGELWNQYGPTETTIYSTVMRVTESSRTIPIGKPIDNTTTYVLEPSGQFAPLGVPGELCIGGTGLARGYRNRPELTAEKFVILQLPDGRAERVYRTGDLARWRADGELEFIGRRDDQVKLRGFRIELGEIEAVLATNAGVRQCAVVVRESAPGDQQLIAYVVGEGENAPDAAAMRSTLRAKLPDYMIPNLFVTLEALPLSPNGKIDRKALAAFAAPTTLSQGRTPVEPRTASEVMVRDVFRDALERTDIGAGDNFFDLGGHSMTAARLMLRLRAACGHDLPLRSLFEHPTVAGLAGFIDTLDPGAVATLGMGQRAIVPLQAGGTCIPIFAVPGHNGDVFCYRALSQCLGQDQPFFGLQPPGVDGLAAPLDSVEALAEYFVAQIRTFRPEGPVMVAGFCAGGVTATEVARRLEQQGSLRALLLFGSLHPRNYRLTGQLRIALRLALLKLRRHFDALRALRGRGIRQYFAQRMDSRLRERRAEELAVADPVIAHRRRVEAATLGALRRYRGVFKLHAPVGLFLPDDMWSLQREKISALWHTLSADVQDFVGPPGSNGDNLLRQPQVVAFADRTRGFLDERVHRQDLSQPG